jgi:hypothetical protein
MAQMSLEEMTQLYERAKGRNIKLKYKTQAHVTLDYLSIKLSHSFQFYTTTLFYKTHQSICVSQPSLSSLPAFWLKPHQHQQPLLLLLLQL